MMLQHQEQEFKIQSISMLNSGHIKIRSRTGSHALLPTRDSIDPFQIWELSQDIKLLGIKSRKSMLKLLDACYNNKANQFFACNNMGIPYSEGPVSLLPMPHSFLPYSNQLKSLFEYIKKIKESYMCWLIFMDYELGILNLKLFTNFQQKQLQDRICDPDIIVGMFVGQKYFPKGRTYSTQSVMQKIGLSQKTTKDSINTKSQQGIKKGLKSISVSQKQKHSHSTKSMVVDSKLHHKHGSEKSDKTKKGVVKNGNTLTTKGANLQKPTNKQLCSSFSDY